MKTARQHFNELPVPLGQICIEEAEKWQDLSEEFELASDALRAAFDWELSELGWEFYVGLIKELFYHESQPIELNYQEASKEIYNSFFDFGNTESFQDAFNRLFKITRR